MQRDERTTPRWLQVPGVMALSLLGLYFLACFSFANSDSLPQWSWLGRWTMFSARSTYHYAVEGEALKDGKWTPFEATELFPYQWGSGPRYARSAFFRNNQRMRVLASATCGRLPAKPTRVRYFVRKWKGTTGQLEQPYKQESRELRVDWRCGDPISLPRGRRI